MGEQIGAELEQDFVALKIGVLKHLRALFHERALNREILPLEIIHVASSLGVSEKAVQGTIAELLKLNLARPNPSTPEIHAIKEGRCEITTEGLSFLHQYETFFVHQHGTIKPSTAEARPRVGFEA